MKYTYLGHNVNYFECNGVKIIVDPWLEGNPIVTKKSRRKKLIIF